MTVVWLTVFAIVVAMIVGAGQIWYGYQTKLSNRPNVSVQALMSKKFAPGERMVLVAQLKNFGNTEAHDVSARSTLVPGVFTKDQEAFDLVLILNNGQPDTHAVQRQRRVK